MPPASAPVLQSQDSSLNAVLLPEEGERSGARPGNPLETILHKLIRWPGSDVDDYKLKITNGSERKTIKLELTKDSEIGTTQTMPTDQYQNFCTSFPELESGGSVALKFNLQKLQEILTAKNKSRTMQLAIGLSLITEVFLMVAGLKACKDNGYPLLAMCPVILIAGFCVMRMKKRLFGQWPGVLLSDTNLEKCELIKRLSLSLGVWSTASMFRIASTKEISEVDIYNVMPAMMITFPPCLQMLFETMAGTRGYMMKWLELSVYLLIAGGSRLLSISYILGAMNFLEVNDETHSISSNSTCFGPDLKCVEHTLKLIPKSLLMMLLTFITLFLVVLNFFWEKGAFDIFSLMEKAHLTCSQLCSYFDSVLSKVVGESGIKAYIMTVMMAITHGAEGAFALSAFGTEYLVELGVSPAGALALQWLLMTALTSLAEDARRQRIELREKACALTAAVEDAESPNNQILRWIMEALTNSGNGLLAPASLLAASRVEMIMNTNKCEPQSFSQSENGNVTSLEEGVPGGGRESGLTFRSLRLLKPQTMPEEARSLCCQPAVQ